MNGKWCLVNHCFTRSQFGTLCTVIIHYTSPIALRHLQCPLIAPLGREAREDGIPKERLMICVRDQATLICIVRRVANLSH